MKDRLYVSTNAFQTRHLNSIIDVCKENGFTNLELSACNYFDKTLYDSLIELRREGGFRFLVHHYFPPPGEPFVLNLASNDTYLLELSRQHCRDAIDLSADLGAPFFSVHAGHCYDVRPEQLGKKMAKFDVFPMEEAYDIMIESIQLLADYASKRHIAIAIENHVLTPSFLVNGKNSLLFAVTAEELLGVISNVDRRNVAVLIDVGHLKVSAMTLGFPPEKFLQTLAPFTVAVHLSDNNGSFDEHKKVRKDSWFWDILFACFSENIFLVLESSWCTVKQIVDQKRLLLSGFKNGRENIT